MPENKMIHELPIAEQTSSSDLFETEIPSQLMQSGFASRKVSAAEIADLMLNDMTYPQALQTTAKKIIPAINEAAQSGGGGASVIQKTMAEYTALPTADKMNGSIYKITDKALIYCLDEEYHALKEITSADYAQLTSDEQNNGTLYILTDGTPPSETVTGSDIIPFIDVSDSNKPKSTTAAAVAGLAMDSLLKVVTFPNSASISIAANSAVNITANDLNIATPTGYTPVAIASVYSTSNDVVMRSFNCYATGTTSFGVARNISGNTVSVIFNCAILYAKRGAVV